MRWLMKLYPQAWRDRYEAEMLALLEQHRVSPATVLDLVVGALDARLHYREGVIPMALRLKSAVVTMFCAFMLFGVGWGMLQRLPDPAPTFHTASQAHPALAIVFQALFVVGFISFLAFMGGGVPLLFMAIRRSLTHRHHTVLRPFTLAVACLVAFVASTGGLVVWRPESHILAILIGYLLLVAVLLVIGTVCIAQVIARTDFRVEELKFTLIPEVVILFGMAISVILSVMLIVMVAVDAPGLFGSQDVDVRMFVTGLTFMALGTIFGFMGLRRGWLDRGESVEVG